MFIELRPAPLASAWSCAPLVPMARSISAQLARCSAVDPVVAHPARTSSGSDSAVITSFMTLSFLDVGACRQSPGESLRISLQNGKRIATCGANGSFGNYSCHGGRHCRDACNQLTSTDGVSMQSEAPAFIAWAAIASSLLPVIMIADSRCSALRRRQSKAIPSSLGDTRRSHGLRQSRGGSELPLPQLPSVPFDRSPRRSGPEISGAIGHLRCCVDGQGIQGWGGARSGPPSHA